jgi:hypothetical protein
MSASKDSPQDSVAFVTIDGVDYAAREHKYAASVLRLADSCSAVIPAPEGKVLGADGKSVSVSDVATMGAPLSFALADPNVNGGKRVAKFSGVVTGRQFSQSLEGGLVLNVTGADLGWKLSSCGPAHLNLRGLTWSKFLAKVCGLTVDGKGNVTADAFGWGFKGAGSDNTVNRKLRLGRQTVQSDFDRRAAAKTSLLIPRFQIEPGETIDSVIVKYAKIDHFLVNVSTDGWIQIFRPDYAQKASYSFFHYPTSDSNHKKNNVIGPMFSETADSLYTRVECWSTVVDGVNNDPTDQNAGTYRGKFLNAGTLPFLRAYTFSDAEQMGQDRVDARAKWQWQRGQFDAWTYKFTAVGHSQSGVPFVEDTMCELHDAVYGIDGLFYVSAVEPSRKLARPGKDSGSGAGTRCEITLKRPNFLAA